MDHDIDQIAICALLHKASHLTLDPQMYTDTSHFDQNLISYERKVSHCQQSFTLISHKSLVPG